MPQQQNAQTPEGFPAYGVPTGSTASAGTLRPDGATSAAQDTSVGPRPAVARPTQPHAGWMTPPSTSKPRQWTPCPMSTHHPRTVSSRVDLVITGLLILVTAVVPVGIYIVDKGPAIPLIAAQAAEQTTTRIISIGGSVCLIIVGLSLMTVALRDRSAGWLTTLFIIGLISMISTAAIGIEDVRKVNQYIDTTTGNIGKQTMLDQGVDKIGGGNPTGSITFDLTGTSVGTSKTITVDWQAWSQLTIQMAEGQPVQTVCQPSIGTLSTNVEGNGQAASLDNCSDATVTSPIWGESSLGGVTIPIVDEVDTDTLTIVQSFDPPGTWGSTPAPTFSVTPSATPTLSTTPTGSRSGDWGRTTTVTISNGGRTTQLSEWGETTSLLTVSITTSGQDATTEMPASLPDPTSDLPTIFCEVSITQMPADPFRVDAGTENQAGTLGVQGSQTQTGVPASPVGTGGHTVFDPTSTGESTLRGDEAGAAPGAQARAGATPVPGTQTWSAQHTLGITYPLPKALSRGVRVGSFVWAPLVCMVDAFLIVKVYITNPNLPILGINAVALPGIILIFTALFSSRTKKNPKQGIGSQTAPNSTDVIRRG